MKEDKLYNNMTLLNELLGVGSASEKAEIFAEALKLEVQDVFKDVFDGKLSKEQARGKIIGMVDAELNNL